MNGETVAIFVSAEAARTIVGPLTVTLTLCGVEDVKRSDFGLTVKLLESACACAGGRPSAIAAASVPAGAAVVSSDALEDSAELDATGTVLRVAVCGSAPSELGATDGETPPEPPHATSTSATSAAPIPTTLR
jgi:hypothetical protein